MTNTQIAKLYLATNTTATAAQIDTAVTDGSAATAVTALTAANFLEAAYQATFGRPVDAEGAAYWANEMTNGMTQTQVLAALPAGAAAYVAPTVANPLLINGVEFTAAPVGVSAANDVIVAANKATADANAAANGITVGNTATIVATVTAVTATVSAAATAVDAAVDAATIDGETFALTSANDEIISGTAANDLFVSTLGTMHAGDILQDLSTTDADILNAAINSNDLATRIQNVETVNLTGEYVKTGIALTNVSGVKDLNLDTKIAGGVATVTAASSLNAENINAGSKIGTVNVTSLTSGTRDAVNVDAGSAQTISITGATAGADNYNLTVADGATITLVNTTAGTTNELNSAGDEVTINATGEIDLVSNQDTKSGTATLNQALDITVNASDDLQINLSGTTASLIAKSVTVDGSGDVTMVSADGKDIAGTLTAVTGTTASTNTYDGVEMTDVGTGTSTVAIENIDVAVALDLSKAAVDVIKLTGSTATTNILSATGTQADVSINQAALVDIAADLVGTLAISVDNGDKDTAFTTGTFMAQISEAQGTKSTITYDASDVDTILISAKADEVTDYDADDNGYDEVSSMAINAIAMATFTDGASITNDSQVMVFQGDEAISVATVSMSGTQTISAGALGAGLTLSSVIAAASSDDLTIVGSDYNDVILAASASAILDIQGGAGNDIITSTSAKDTTEISGGAGNDTITTGANATTVDAGSGDDIVVISTKDTVTLGDGTDTVRLSTAGLTGESVTDFVLGTDVVELRGVSATPLAATAAIDLSDVTVTAGVYTLLTAATDYTVTLKNGGAALTETDVRDSVKLTYVALKTGTDNVLGDLADSVVVTGTDTGGSITTGSGADTVIIAADTTASTTIKDFTVGEDTVVLVGTIATATAVNLKNVADVSGVYTIGTATAGASVRLMNAGSDISTDNDLEASIQLGASATNTFTVTAGATTADNITISGGDFNDFVTITAGATSGTATYNFKDDAGVDTVVMATPTLSATGAEFVDFNALTGIDTVTDAANSKIDVAADAAKIADAKDGAVYVFADSSNGTGTTDITTFLTHNANGYTQDVINDEIAAFLDAGLGVQAGENYVVIINDTSSIDYAVATGGGVDPLQYAAESFIYYVAGDADGIDADNITLIGMVDDGTAGNAGGAGTATAYVDATIIA